MTGSAPAGWYASIVRRGEQRYWNGAAWTSAFAADGVTREHADANAEPPPPRPSSPFRWLILVWTAVGVAVLVVGAIVVWQFIPTTITLDPEVVEGSVDAWLNRNEIFPGSQVSTACPDSMVGEVGTRFTCELEGGAAEGYQVVVTIDNEDGYISWGLN